ncbi:hypothetical protein AIOL_002781 [Candidatus Rhodobacter oscarellae]|uniref:Uncharacterized protein n=1 Tax=Candidatus Rhodobacter oscarellae TaxID=1675527 RepID=A0A0J9GW80_9RHOB|nr:hypothetical protein AIOL_002781 [Candidatus Rhodobacter lobularis]
MHAGIVAADAATNHTRWPLNGGQLLADIRPWRDTIFLQENCETLERVSLPRPELNLHAQPLADLRAQLSLEGKCKSLARDLARPNACSSSKPAPIPPHHAAAYAP